MRAWSAKHEKAKTDVSEDHIIDCEEALRRLLVVLRVGRALQEHRVAARRGRPVDIGAQHDAVAHLRWLVLLDPNARNTGLERRRARECGEGEEERDGGETTHAGTIVGGGSGVKDGSGSSRFKVRSSEFTVQSSELQFQFIRPITGTATGTATVNSELLNSELRTVNCEL